MQKTKAAMAKAGRFGSPSFSADAYAAQLFEQNDHRRAPGVLSSLNDQREETEQALKDYVYTHYQHFKNCAVKFIQYGAPNHG
jgi:hypothetical protein